MAFHIVNQFFYGRFLGAAVVGVMKVLCRSVMVIWLSLAALPAWSQSSMKVVVLGDVVTSGYRLHDKQSFATVLKRSLWEQGYQSVDVVDFTSPDFTSANALSEIDTLLLTGQMWCWCSWVRMMSEEG